MKPAFMLRGVGGFVAVAKDQGATLEVTSIRGFVLTPVVKLAGETAAQALAREFPDASIDGVERIPAKGGRP